MSENTRLVAMATRVEQLNVQLRECEERYMTVHRKLIQGKGAANGQKYEVGCFTLGCDVLS